MGEYMAASDGPRETMRRNMKYERMAPSLLYSKVAESVSSFLSSPTRDHRILTKCQQLLEDERDSATNATKRDNAVYALRSLEVFERSLNALPLAGLQFQKIGPLKPMEIEGVKVSVQPTALVTQVRPRGKNLRGAIIVDTAKGVEPKSDEARAQATMAMTHTAYLLHELVNDRIVAEDEKPSTDHCMVFHTYRQELVASPSNYRRMLGNMKAACRDIAARWDSIDPPPSFDPAAARYRN